MQADQQTNSISNNNKTQQMILFQRYDSQKLQNEYDLKQIMNSQNTPKSVVNPWHKQSSAFSNKNKNNFQSTEKTELQIGRSDNNDGITVGERNRGQRNDDDSRSSYDPEEVKDHIPGQQQ